ncbi:MAG: LPS assembly lipoprotein LptE [Pseudomonadota bacterium]
MSRGLVLCLQLLLISGCGFHLRTYSFETGLRTYALQAPERYLVVPPLRAALRQAKVEAAPASDADLVLQLLDQRSERRNASTAGGARAVEYEVLYAVQYQILNAQGEELAAPTWVQRQRIFRLDRGNIVGSSEEQTLIQQELLQDTVSQIVRAMDTVSRRVAANPGTSDAG